jgi:hypothetical protein
MYPTNQVSQSKTSRNTSAPTHERGRKSLLTKPNNVYRKKLFRRAAHRFETLQKIIIPATGLPDGLFSNQKS